MLLRRGRLGSRSARPAGWHTHCDLNLPAREAEGTDHATRETQRRRSARTGAGAAAPGGRAPDDRRADPPGARAGQRPHREPRPARRGRQLHADRGAHSRAAGAAGGGRTARDQAREWRGRAAGCDGDRAATGWEGGRLRPGLAGRGGAAARALVGRVAHRACPGGPSQGRASWPRRRVDPNDWSSCA